MNYLDGKSIIITGAGSGFGRLVAEKAAASGASILCADINAATAEEAAQAIRSAGGKAEAVRADVCEVEDFNRVVARAVEAFGHIDVLINNAGTMPLAFLSDHEAALDAWHRCIDINFKGVVNGTSAVYDQMVQQGRGHIVNISSIYGNHAVAGAAVYGATKAAVNYFTNAIRTESRGKIKVTLIRPTGVAGTGLGETMINPEAVAGIMGQNAGIAAELVAKLGEGTLPAEQLDPENIQCSVVSPAHVADAIIHCINQPWGINIGEISLRSSNEYFIL